MSIVRRSWLRTEHGVREQGNPVWLERIDLSTRPTVDVDRLREQPDYLGDMLTLAAGLVDWQPRSPRTEVGEAGVPAEEPAAAATVRATLSGLLDEARVARALGSDPWDELRFEELLHRAESIAVENLAPSEIES